MTYRFPTLLLIAVLTGLPLAAQDSLMFISEARQQYKNISDNLLQTAEKMPAENYQFRPTPDSLSFGEWIREVSASQQDVCSAVSSKRVQMTGIDPRGKAELIDMLQRSIHSCDAAYTSVNPFTASQEIGFAGSRHSRLGLLFLNVSHDYEVYGNLSTYLRLKGLVPPSVKARLLPIGAPQPDSH